MPSNFTVSLERLIKDFSMESVYLPAEPASILISSSEVNRPGLFITGFYDYFDPDRIQILGRMETAFLSDLSHEVLLERINRLGIGPQGLGGTVTALAVSILPYGTHIAQLPVCVNLCCHVCRHASGTL